MRAPPPSPLALISPCSLSLLPRGEAYTSSTSHHSVRLDPHWSASVRFGPPWSAFVRFGPHLSALVHIGPPWSALVRIGPLWSALVRIGPPWSALVHLKAKEEVKSEHKFLLEEFVPAYSRPRARARRSDSGLARCGCGDISVFYPPHSGKIMP